jgi:hypothetical protein
MRGESMTDTTHECPAPGCDKRVPFEMFACKAHWFTIPTPLRSRLWSEWRDNPGEDSYFEVRADCLRALGVPEDQVAEENAGVA